MELENKYSNPTASDITIGSNMYSRVGAIAGFPGSMTSKQALAGNPGYTFRKKGGKKKSKKKNKKTGKKSKKNIKLIGGAGENYNTSALPNYNSSRVEEAEPQSDPQLEPQPEYPSNPSSSNSDLMTQQILDDSQKVSNIDLDKDQLIAGSNLNDPVMNDLENIQERNNVQPDTSMYSENDRFQDSNNPDMSGNNIEDYLNGRKSLDKSTSDLTDSDKMISSVNSSNDPENYNLMEPLEKKEVTKKKKKTWGDFFSSNFSNLLNTFSLKRNIDHSNCESDLNKYASDKDMQKYIKCLGNLSHFRWVPDPNIASSNAFDLTKTLNENIVEGRSGFAFYFREVDSKTGMEEIKGCKLVHIDDLKREQQEPDEEQNEYNLSEINNIMNQAGGKNKKTKKRRKKTSKLSKKKGYEFTFNKNLLKKLI